MPHKAKDVVLRPNPGKLDKAMESLDCAHQNRQNSKAVPVKMSPPKRPQR